MKLRDLKTITLTDIDSALISNDLSLCQSNLEYLLITHRQLKSQMDQIKIYKRIIFLIQKIIELDEDNSFNRKQIYHNLGVVLEYWKNALAARTPPNRESEFHLYRHRLLKQEFFIYALRIVNKSFEELLEPNQRFIQISMKTKNRIVQNYPDFVNDSSLKKLLKESMNQTFICEALKYLSLKTALLLGQNTRRNAQDFYEYFSQFCKSCFDHYEENRVVMINNVLNSLSIMVQLEIKQYLGEANLEKCYELIKFFKFLLTNFRLKKVPLLVSYIKSIEKYTYFLKEKTAAYELVLQILDINAQKLERKKFLKAPKRDKNKQNQDLSTSFLSRKMREKQKFKRDGSSSKSTNQRSQSFYEVIDQADKKHIQVLKMRGNSCIYKNTPKRFQHCSRMRIKSDIQNEARVNFSISQSQMIQIKTEDLNKKRQEETKVALYQVFLTQYEQKRKSSFGIFPRESKLKLFKKSMIHLITQPCKE